MRNRPWRRAQRERVIARTRRQMKSRGWFSEPYTRWTTRDAEVAIRKNAVTPHPCSGFCCGNPRKWFGDLTLQEERVRDWKDRLCEDDECEDHHAGDDQ